MSGHAQITAEELSLHQKLMAIIQSPAYAAEEAARRKLQDSCAHVDWNFQKHGRCCHKCGAFMVDFGD